MKENKSVCNECWFEKDNGHARTCSKKSTPSSKEERCDACGYRICGESVGGKCTPPIPKDSECKCDCLHCIQLVEHFNCKWGCLPTPKWNFSTIDSEWEEKFKFTKFAKGGGSCFECCDYEGMYADLLIFIRGLLHKERTAIRKEMETVLEIEEKGARLVAWKNMQDSWQK